MTESLALPRPARDLLNKVRVDRRHPGLQLDKFSVSRDQRQQYAALAKVTMTALDSNLLAGLRLRRQEMLAATGAVCHRLSTGGPLTLHLSRSGTLENAGIALHPIYGFTYLPGSGIKGLARAWAETVWAPAQADKETAWQMIDRAFGWSPGSEKNKKWRDAGGAHDPKNSAAGRLVFHDAWPAEWPKLQVDILNNHHTKYYQGEDDPGDWEDPVPVYFLCIGADATFDFPISCRGETDGELMAQTGEWLRAALAVEGAGAKTAAGYGRFEAPQGEPEAIIPDRLARESHELRLSAPAFLAGAGQEEADCDLRPATMRGLLRWWWRTMHAAHVDRETLRRLEAAVWGDAEHGSAVRLAVHPVGLHRPQEHPDKGDREFARQHDLVPPRDGKTIQGLYYASYGMGENEKIRWFRPAGCRWQVTFTARTAQFPSDESGTGIEIEPEMLLQQARATLWLLARFGGAGSRSRKGFGSFNDIEIPGIGSIEDCKRVGNELRKACGMAGDAGRTNGPALEQARPFELTTPWKDPWFAIDRAGMALQTFAKSQAADKRLALGLPRNMGPGRGSPLKAGKIERHASPALWSLSGAEDGSLTIRLIAFTAPRLPDPSTSEAVMQDLVVDVRKRLGKDVREHDGRNQRRPPPTSPGAQSQQTRAAPSLPPKGEYVDAVLLEERTKKDGWRARHEASGKEMHIQNTQDVPESCEPNQIVELYVFSNDAFEWPTDAVRERVERANRPGSRGPQRGGHKPKGRR